MWALKYYLLLCFSVAFVQSVIAADHSTDMVVTNNIHCTDIGSQLLKRGATVPEIFIAVSACEGLVNPQDAGLGGGFQAVIYNGSCNGKPQSWYVNAREKSASIWKEPRRSYDFRGIGIPSVLKGYEALYTDTRCGYRPMLNWSDLFMPNIALSKSGWTTTPTMLKVLKKLEHYENIFQLIAPNSIKNTVLGDTFQLIAQEGPHSSLYKKGGILNEIVSRDFRISKVKIPASDIFNYKVSISNATRCIITYPRRLIVHTTKLPGSGQCICLGLKIISQFYKHYDLNNDSVSQFIILQQVQRFLYAIQPYLKQYTPKQLNAQVAKVVRKIIGKIQTPQLQAKLNMQYPTMFGNLPLQPLSFGKPYGTTNVVIKQNKTVLVATSTINFSFGSKIYSRQLGFFYNNQLDDFAYKSKHPNYARPDTNPQSSICGTIITSKHNNPVLAMGGAGGRKILGAVFQSIVKYLFEKRPLVNAINDPRCLILKSGTLTCENNLNKEIKQLLLTGRVNVVFGSESGYSAVTGIATLRNNKEAVYDTRRGGKGFIRSHKPLV